MLTEVQVQDSFDSLLFNTIFSINNGVINLTEKSVAFLFNLGEIVRTLHFREAVVNLLDLPYSFKQES